VLRDYTHQLPDEYLAEKVFPYLSTDAQIYLKCQTCKWEYRLSPQVLLAPDATAFDGGSCRDCGEDALRFVRHLRKLSCACRDCGAAFEVKTSGFEDLRCGECLSTNIAVDAEEIAPSYPLRFRQLVLAKSRPWGEDLDEDLRTLAEEPGLTQLLPQRALYLVPTALFCHRLYDYGGYSNQAQMQAFLGIGDAAPDLAGLLNLEGLLLREYFKQTGELTAGLQSFRVLAAAAATTAAPHDRALREHNVAMAAYSVLTRVEDEIASPLAGTESILAEGIAAARRALAYFETSGSVDPTLRRTQRTRIHHLLGDLARVNTDDPQQLQIALEHYEAALSDASDVPAEYRTIVEAARAATLTASAPVDSELRRTATHDLERYLAEKEMKRVWSDKWVDTIIQARNYEELGRLRKAQRLFERAAAIAYDEIEVAVDEQTIRQRGERFVGAFDELARICVRTGKAERALDAVEAVRGAALRVYTRAGDDRDRHLVASARRQRRVVLAGLLGRSPPHTRAKRAQLRSVLERVRALRPSVLPNGTAFICLSLCRSVVTAIVVSGPEAKVTAEQWTIPLESSQTLVDQPSLVGGPFRERRLRALCVSASLGLFEPLLPRLRRTGVTRLAISAPGPLSQLPFEAFLLGDGRVVADEFQILYLPALSLGVDLVERSAARTSGNALLVGYADEDLPRTAEEMQALEMIWNGRARVLDRDEHTKRGVLQALSEDYDHIHFATHGTFDPFAPLESALHLVRDPDRDSQRLTAADLARLSFGRAPVVTLSACSSALTSYGSTNDCTGLTGSLLRAGARCVIGSRWPVYDSTATRFMAELHERMAGGAGTAQECVHETQRSLRRAGARAEDWAAFSYLGIPL
jgi:tetratricopeptide (TPR) repeat protein